VIISQSTEVSSLLEHPADLCVVQIPVQSLIKVPPPLEQHRLADELEPGRELQVFVLKLSFEFAFRHVLDISYFVRIRVDVNFGGWLDEENVIDFANPRLAAVRDMPGETRLTFMFPPFSIAWSLVVYSGEELELVQGNLLRLDSKLLVQFALRCSLHAHH
jgi:hypothetical protein